MKKTYTTSIITIAVIAIIIFIIIRLQPQTKPTPITETPTPVGTTVSYACNNGKTIDATYYTGESTPATAGQPPVPGGSVALVFNDRGPLTLSQTISADGSRYANSDESFVFWSKGNGALVLENNTDKTYIGCVTVAPDTTGTLPQVYQNGTQGISLRYPALYSFDESYKYEQLGLGKSIYGVKFTIPGSLAAGTNLGSDSYISVEQIPNSKTCQASSFLDKGATTSTVTDDGKEYSYATLSGAGAGNRYEETVYAIPGTNPCTAVRYFIHYSAIENYPTGAVKEFDKQSLIDTFDQIRRTLVINQ